MKYGAYSERWEKLLSLCRFNDGDSQNSFLIKEPGPQEGRSPFEADIGRVVFSQPFRRLAGKTQVHPFSSIDYVHNRLTHSIEVGYISRSLGRMAAMFMHKITGDLKSESDIEKVGWICQAAGLMHDMGNPPYGHAGEDAIKAWAKKNYDMLTKICGPKVAGDYLYFDGNAQAFRMASRPGLRESCYFKLTLASLGAMVKYPYPTNSPKGEKGKSTAFSSEEGIFGMLWAYLGLKPEQRHPLSFLTEAADDICYRINDFEDAVLMGLMDERDVKGLFLDGMSFSDQCKYKDASLSRVRAIAIDYLVKEMVCVYRDKYDSIMKGEFNGTLKSGIKNEWSGVLARIKEQYDLIFSERKKVIVEVGAYGQISKVLDRYLVFLKEISSKKSAKDSAQEYSKLPFICQRLITLAWGGKAYYNSNRDKPIDWWAHAVLDFVVGMTDEYLHTVASEFM